MNPSRICALAASAALLAALGCAHRYDRHQARVDAYMNPAYELSRQDSFCFVPAVEAHPEGSLPKQQRYEELVHICADIGQSKGVRIFAEHATGCFPASLDWSVDGDMPLAALASPNPEPPTLLASNGPVALLQMTPAPPAYSPAMQGLHHQQMQQQMQASQNPGLFRRPRHQRGQFRKVMKLVASHPTASESLVEATAVMWSGLDAFTDNTARVLCRALLQDFPSRVNIKSYTIALPRER